MHLGLSSALGLIFIVLKLTGHITWPWVWVLAPFWIGFILFIILLVAVVYFGRAPAWRLRK